MIKLEDIDKSMSFDEYYQLNEKLAKEGGTTGDDKSDLLIDYTKLNFARLKRIYKTTAVADEVINNVDCFQEPLTWVVFSETWCGDAAQNLPIFAKITETIPNISLRILLRDEHPDLMDNYLTNGGKSIPKLVALDENFNELGTWGPRPQILQDWLHKEKANPTMEMADLKKEFQIWYTKDKGQTLQKEMIASMKSWITEKC